MTNNAVLYGAGKRCEELCKIAKGSKIQIIHILDEDINKWGEKIEGYEIASPQIVLNSNENFKICITIENIDLKLSVRKELRRKYHLKEENEISYNMLLLEMMKSNTIIKEKIFFKKFNMVKEKSTLFDCCNGLVLGGVEAWTTELCTVLRKKGNKRIYIISDIGEFNVPSDLLDCILYERLNRQKTSLLSRIVRLIEIIMNHLPCNIVVSQPNEILWAAYLLKCYYSEHIKIISVIHNGFPNLYEYYSEIKYYSDIFVCVSKDIQQEMINMGIAKEKVFSMTCPFHCDKILVRNYTVDKIAPLCIGYAGRLVYEQKRMDLLLKLITLLLKRQISFKMSFAGEGIAYTDMIQYVNDNNLNTYVNFCGTLSRTELSTFWQRQDICVNLADYEGRCISKLEAMANGAVPIVTDTFGMKEDIENGVNGYIVPIGDYITAAKRIEFLSQSRKKLINMGIKAHNSVYPKSSMEKHANFWEELLQIR